MGSPERPTIFLVAALATVVTGACSLFPSFDDLRGGTSIDGGRGTDASGDAAEASTSPPDASTTDCPGTAPPEMVRVGSFCIDSTEVTASQYKAFTNAMGTDLRNQPSTCSWNTTLYPGQNSHPADWAVPPGSEAKPITYVNWCQAAAYCNWAGKRLCGRIGGGAVPWGAEKDPSVSQWMSACSKGGVLTYPYGSTFDASACVTGSQSAALVKSHPSCQGGYAGIFDMSGNVHEWEDACAGDGPNDPCQLRGGAWDGTAGGTRCDSNEIPQFKKVAGDNMGFRCCSP